MSAHIAGIPVGDDPDPCPTCLRYTRLLIAGLDLDATECRTAIRELAAHLPKHTERRAA